MSKRRALCCALTVVFSVANSAVAQRGNAPSGGGGGGGAQPPCATCVTTSAPASGKLPVFDIGNNVSASGVSQTVAGVSVDRPLNVAGAVGATGVNSSGGVTAAGNVSGNSVSATGAVTAATVTATGGIAAGGDGSISGNLTVGGTLSGQNLSIANLLTATRTNFSSDPANPSVGDHTVVGDAGIFKADLGGVIGWDTHLDSGAENNFLTGVQGLISNTTGAGVLGDARSTSGQTRGVYGRTRSSDGKGVMGIARPTSGPLTGSGGGVYGITYYTDGVGVLGESLTANAHGVMGLSHSDNGSGVIGISDATTGNSNGVFGILSNLHGAAVLGYSNSTDPTADTFAMRAHNATMFGSAIEVAVNGGTATDLIRGVVQTPGSASIVYRVDRNGTVHSGAGADVAEHIPAIEPLTAGDVVEIDPATGSFRKVRSAMSTLVAGIISTQPGVTLGNQKADDPRPMLALVGRVPVNVVSEGGPIAIGDLLVSSSKAGYAMRCANRSECVGAVVGKALQPLPSGTGTIQVLVTLQ